MSSATESRMMFGESWAESLLMKGALLYKDIGQPKRYQAIYLGDHELHEKTAVGNRDSVAISRA